MSRVDLDWEGFQWDHVNLLKNWDKHGVSPSECEQVFFNRPLMTESDVPHSNEEQRWYSLGTTDAGRTLFVVFTIRSKLIRVISARDMRRKERRLFEELEDQ
ncbi:MAG: BrnT family toxin [Rhodothermia bacterium]